MTIPFHCPQCGKGFNADEKFAGKTVRCKQCGAQTRVPSLAVGGQEPMGPAPEDLYGLADPAPALPPRVAIPAAEVSASKPKNKRQPATSKRSFWPAKGSSWGVVVAGIVILRLFMRLNRGNQAVPAADQGVPRPTLASMVVTEPAGPPAFPPRGTGTVIRPGVRFFEARASGPANVATMNMTVWVYLPEGAHEPRSLPCVVIAPAGSIILTGMDLGDGDRAEQLPYIAAGYAVLAYSLDGHADNVQQLSDPRVGQACAQFAAARAGLSNAKAAIDWMAKSFPEIDPERLYTAGHSSAGTMALLLAENDTRIKACSAFAPRSDTEGNFNVAIRAIIRRAIPPAEAIFTTYNPSKHIQDVKCPVLLFQARDDPVVAVSETESFASALQGAGKDVTVELVPSGGHYDPMIKEGIARAIAFFAAHGSRAAGQSGAGE